MINSLLPYRNQTPNDPTGPIGFLNSYMSSPEFKRKYLLNHSDADYSNAMKYFGKQAKAYSPVQIDVPTSDIPDFQSQAFVNKDAYQKQFMKEHNLPANTNIVINGDQAKQIGMGLLTSILPHEYAHTTRDLDAKDEKNIINLWKDKAAAQQVLGDYQSSKSKGSVSNYLKNVAPAENHDFQPNEQYSDLNALRYLMYKQGIYDARNGQMTNEQLEKAKKDPLIGNDGILKRMLQHFSDDELIQLNNTIAARQTGGENMA